MEKTRGNVVAGGLGGPYLCADKWGRTTGEGDRPGNPGFQHVQNKASEPLRVVAVGETASLTVESGAHGVLECT